MRRWLVGWKYALLVLGLAFLALMIMDFNGRMTEWRRLSAEREHISVQVTHLVATQANLQTQIAYATSDAGVLEWAYEDGHWVRKGDVLVVPIASGESTPVPTPAPVVTAQPVSNLQLWLSLFVDPDAP